MVDRSVDVAIVGGGLAGASLATMLSRQGISVAMCDPHAVAPPDFRAEKLTRAQLVTFMRLGLSRAILAQATPIDRLAIARFGEIVEERPNGEVALDYADLVNAVRADVPPACRILGRVARVDAGADRQTIMLGDGGRINARLLVVATGLGRTLLKPLGIKRVTVANDHCLAVGFDMTFSGAGPSSLTTFGSSKGDRSAYLTLFPIKDRVRANLFIYRHHDEDWARSFRANPRDQLREMMPELDTLLPSFSVSNCVLRPIHLYSSDGHVRDGVVLVGDAFATTCPTGGTGIDKVLTDVERLAALVPGWLATPGMVRAKVRQFYADPAKCASDRNATRATAYARAMALEGGLLWSARRYRNFYVQKLRYWARQRMAGLHAALPSPDDAVTDKVALHLLSPSKTGHHASTDLR